MRITGRVVVITGAGSGIGAAMARRFAAEGASGICVSDVDGAAVESTAETVAEVGTRVIARRTDVTDEEQVRAMVDATVDELGPVDLMCSNAGIATGAGLDASPEQWADAWAVNVGAHVYAARAVVPGMVARGGGHLLHTCSAAGLLTQPGDAPYAVTKHAAVAFAEWLAVTYGDRGIGVSALCPQGVRTPLLTEGLGRDDEAARVVAAAGRLLEPDEVAEAAVAGLAEKRFLILPHPEVAEFVRRKADDTDRWLAGVRRLAETARGEARGLPRSRRPRERRHGRIAFPSDGTCYRFERSLGQSRREETRGRVIAGTRRDLAHLLRLSLPVKLRVSRFLS